MVNLLPHDTGVVKDAMVVRVARWLPARGVVV